MVGRQEFSGSGEIGGRIIRGELWKSAGELVMEIYIDNISIIVTAKNLVEMKKALEDTMLFAKKNELW